MFVWKMLFELRIHHPFFHPFLQLPAKIICLSYQVANQLILPVNETDQQPFTKHKHNKTNKTFQSKKCSKISETGKIHKFSKYQKFATFSLNFQVRLRNANKDQLIKHTTLKFVYMVGKKIKNQKHRNEGGKHLDGSTGTHHNIPIKVGPYKPSWIQQSPL